MPTRKYPFDPNLFLDTCGDIESALKSSLVLLGEATEALRADRDRKAKMNVRVAYRELVAVVETLIHVLADDLPSVPGDPNARDRRVALPTRLARSRNKQSAKK